MKMSGKKSELSTKFKGGLIYTTNMRTVVAVADPVLAKELYQNESNMAHAWDQGIGHFIVRYIGNYWINCFSQRWK